MSNLTVNPFIIKINKITQCDAKLTLSSKTFNIKKKRANYFKKRKAKKSDFEFHTDVLALLLTSGVQLLFTTLNLFDWLLYCSSSFRSRGLIFPRIFESSAVNEAKERE